MSLDDRRDAYLVADELAEVRNRRRRLLEARAATPHLDHHTADLQLAILDRQIADLEAVA